MNRKLLIFGVLLGVLASTGFMACSQKQASQGCAVLTTSPFYGNGFWAKYTILSTQGDCTFLTQGGQKDSNGNIITAEQIGVAEYGPDQGPLTIGLLPASLIGTPQDAGIALGTLNPNTCEVLNPRPASAIIPDPNPPPPLLPDGGVATTALITETDGGCLFDDGGIDPASSDCTDAGAGSTGSTGSSSASTGSTTSSSGSSAGSSTGSSTGSSSSSGTSSTGSTGTAPGGLCATCAVAAGCASGNCNATGFCDVVASDAGGTGCAASTCVSLGGICSADDSSCACAGGTTGATGSTGTSAGSTTGTTGTPGGDVCAACMISTDCASGNCNPAGYCDVVASDAGGTGCAASNCAANGGTCSSDDTTCACPASTTGGTTGSGPAAPPNVQVVYTFTNLQFEEYPNIPGTQFAANLDYNQTQVDPGSTACHATIRVDAVWYNDSFSGTVGHLSGDHCENDLDCTLHAADFALQDPNGFTCVAMLTNNAVNYPDSYADGGSSLVDGGPIPEQRCVPKGQVPVGAQTQ